MLHLYRLWTFFWGNANITAHLIKDSARIEGRIIHNVASTYIISSVTYFGITVYSMRVSTMYNELSDRGNVEAAKRSKYKIGFSKQSLINNYLRPKHAHVARKLGLQAHRTIRKELQLY